MRNYRPTDIPMAILASLRRLYGRLTPTERPGMEAQWSTPWNTSYPIETFFDRLKDCFVMETRNHPPYTTDQMISKGITAIEVTGIFTTALLEWNGMDPVDQDWATLKHHFGEAYEIYITIGNVGNNPYVGRANNSEIIDDEDDDSVLTITKVVGNMQMVNNAHSQAVREDVTALRREIGFLRAEVRSRNQGAANSIQAAPPPQWAPASPYATAPPPPLAPPQPLQAA